MHSKIKYANNRHAEWVSRTSSKLPLCKQGEAKGASFEPIDINPRAIGLVGGLAARIDSLVQCDAKARSKWSNRTPCVRVLHVVS